MVIHSRTRSIFNTNHNEHEPSGQPSAGMLSERGSRSPTPCPQADPSLRSKSFKKAFDEEKRSTVQYLPQIKQIHHGQPPFEHLRPASGTASPPAAGAPPLQRKWMEKVIAQRTHALRGTTRPPRLPLTYLSLRVTGASDADDPQGGEGGSVLKASCTFHVSSGITGQPSMLPR